MKRRWYIPLVALLLAGGMMWLLGRLTRPKYASGPVKEGSMMANYYAHAQEGHELLLIGDCEVYESVSPVVLFSDFGITSYIRGSAQQLMWQSYYLLKETLRYETPKAVVLSVCSLRYDAPQNEAYNRMTLDGMRLGPEKVQSIAASLTEGEGALSYYVPLLRYHSRVFELTAEDVRYLFRDPELTYNGYLMRCEQVPYTWLPQAPVLLSPNFGERPLLYLNKIRDLCQQKGIALILVKSPCLYPAWYPQWDAFLEDYAQKNGLSYLNAIPYMDEMSIDLSTDTYDGGLHLNVYGAEKYTRWLGEKLRDLPFTDNRLDPKTAAAYAAMTAAYEQQKQQEGSSHE